MFIEMVILTKSSKYKNYCVAGINLKDGSWIRLCSEEPSIAGALSIQNLKASDNTYCDVFDVIEVCIKRKDSSIIQSENFTIDESKPFKKLYKISLKDIIKKHPLEQHKYIFGNQSYKLSYDEAIEQNRSLLMIEVNNLTIDRIKKDNGRIKSKASFFYNGKNYENISITDQNTMINLHQ
jgi:hypothetical protein